MKELIKTRERFKEEIKEFQQKKANQLANLESYDKEIIEIEENLSAALKEYEQHDLNRSRETDLLKDQKVLIDNLNQDFREKLQTVTKEKETLKQKKFQLSLFENDLKTLNEKILQHEKSIKENSEKLEQTRKNKVQSEKELAGLHADTANLEEKLIQQHESRTRQEETYQTQLAELERARTRKNFYQDLIGSYEGHSEATQHIMKSRNSFSGLHGPLSDIISAPENIAVQLETALGNALNYLVVDDVSKAMDIITHIQNSDKGRITCIPLNRINESNLSDGTNRNSKLNFLINHLKFDKKYTTLIEILIGDIVLTDSLKEGLDLAQNNPDLRFISKDGETIHFNREVSGGNQKKRGSALVGRHDQLKKYTRLVSELEKKLKTTEEALNEIRSQMESGRNREKAIRIEKEQSQQNLLEIEKKLSQLQYEINKHKLEKGSDQKEIADFDKSINEMYTEISSQEDLVEKLTQETDDFERNLLTRTEAFDLQNKELESLLEEVQKYRLNATRYQNQLENRQSDIKRANQDIQDYEHNSTSRKKSISDIEEELIRLEQSIKDHEKEQHTIWDSRDGIEAEQKELDQQYQEIRLKIQNAEDEIKKYRREHDSSIEASRSLEIQIRENKLRAENLREQILKEYSEDIEVIIPFDGLVETELEEKIELFKSRIKNLGPVNPLAVSEHDKEKERLDFLVKQRDDLSSAEGSLMETIDQINKTARKNFMDTFEQIKINFEKVFMTFFENGEGTIQLLENDDPLESEIDIIVRTKGRRPQTLSLLSAGEKTLTAISLLFAIYLVKPSPFCILDEVDAPLDDINITRFTDALKNFTNNTQFIIVTHNKRTMESAETMYGVTMEEEGVSKLVSVKFN